MKTTRLEETKSEETSYKIKEKKKFWSGKK